MSKFHLDVLADVPFAASEGRLVTEQGPKGFTPAGVVAAWAAVPAGVKAAGLVAGTVGLGFGAEEVLGG